MSFLADGEYHSGESLARALNISRAAVWKHIEFLKNQGLQISSVRGRGHRLLQPVELLNKDHILGHLNNSFKARLNALDVFFDIESTNQYLLDRLKTDPIHGHVVAAEYQTAGKGRGNNKWLSPPASGLCFSMGWSFDSTPGSLNALSLAVGVAIADALSELGCSGIKLKWPNDIVASGAKLGGILIETQGQVGGKHDVIIGTGINVNMPEQIAALIEQGVTDINHLMQQLPSRNFLLAIILRHLMISLDTFASEGFSAFIEKWRKLDDVTNKNAVLILAKEKISGKVKGIDNNGFLILNVEGKECKFSSGELSLRVMN